MVAYIVIGFVCQGGKFRDVMFTIQAETPGEAKEKAQHQHAGLAISGIVRSHVEAVGYY